MYDSTSSEAYSALALVYYNKNMLEDALNSSQKAIELEEDNFFAHWVQGRIYHISDRDDLAVEEFNRVLEIKPDFQTVYGDLQMAYHTLGQEDKLQEVIDRGLQFYPNYLLKHPEDSRAFIFYANILLQANQNDKARAQLKRALDISPNDPLMMYNAACFYALMGDKSLAVEQLGNAINHGYEDYEYIRRDSDLDSIRDEAGYKELMKESE